MLDIWLSITSDAGYIWNAEDALDIRKKKRILGSWIGCLSQAFQSASSGLPLVLMPEEVDCLLSCKNTDIRLVDADATFSTPAIGEKALANETDDVVAIFNKLREDSYQDQVKIYRNLRQEEIVQMAEKIVDGKKRKLGDSRNSKNVKRPRIVDEDATACSSLSTTEIDQSELRDVECFESVHHLSALQHASNVGEEKRNNERTDLKPYDRCEEIKEDHEQIISEEIGKIKDIHPNSSLVQTFYEYPWLKKCDLVEYPIDKWLSRTQTRTQSLRSATFSFLWNAGFYMTAGDKFGADFLAYQGDPVLFHAKYVVICPDTNALGGSVISERSLVAKCRLGTAVKKTILISSFDNDKETECDGRKKAVKFKRVKWTASNRPE